MIRLLALLIVLASFTPALAAGDYILVLKDHEFTPRVLTVKANTSFVLTIRNEDTTPAAFDGTGLGREREIIEGNAEIDIKLKLRPGNYHVFDPFHSGADGLIVAQ